MRNRTPAALAAAVALSLATTACGTDGSAPTAPPAELAFSRGPGSGGSAADTAVETLVLNPLQSSTWVVGRMHKLIVPAQSVCDPLTSGYGAAYWDSPCSPARERIVVRARSWTDAGGRANIEFEPELRFRPTSKGSVTLYVTDKRAARAGGEIVYCADLADLTTCVDEASTDPTVATQHDLRSGFAYRALKHFSGYMITSGRE